MTKEHVLPAQIAVTEYIPYKNRTYAIKSAHVRKRPAGILTCIIYRVFRSPTSKAVYEME